MNKELLDEKFYEAYHNINPCQAIRKFLDEQFKDVDNAHLKALKHYIREDLATIDPITKQEHELPGMVYGMICEAWRKFLESL
jgi:hypothetical protein